MEDLDKPREVKGAAEDILRTLEAFGFEWDEEVLYQSQRDKVYAEALNTLQNKQLIYSCTCTRKEIADSSNTQGIDGLIYPKTCYLKESLKLSNKLNIHAAYRAIVLDEKIAFLDAIQGEISQNLAHDVGDFIVRRADGLFAYQLAVVVDDAAQGVTHIVRGADLLDSTPRQIYLQQLLSFIPPNVTSPNYAHVPVAVNTRGEKLSKQTLAEPISMVPAVQLIFESLKFLGQNPPLEIKNASLDEVWHWAMTHWNLTSVAKQKSKYYGG